MRAIFISLLPAISFAGIHVMQGDGVTFSSVTLGAQGIRFNDNTVLTSTSTLGSGSGDITGVAVSGEGLAGGGTTGDVTIVLGSTVAKTTANQTWRAPQTLSNSSWTIRTDGTLGSTLLSLEDEDGSTQAALIRGEAGSTVGFFGINGTGQSSPLVYSPGFHIQGALGGSGTATPEFIVETTGFRRTIVNNSGLALFTTAQLMLYDTASNNYIGFRSSNTILGTQQYVLMRSTGNVGDALKIVNKDSNGLTHLDWGTDNTGGGGGSGAANYSGDLSAATTLVVSSTTHGFNSTALVTECWDTSVSPRRRVEGYETTVDSTTFAATFTFPSAFTGSCVINGSGGGGGGFAIVSLSTGVTGVLPVANGGTGTSTPSLVAGTNISITGTWPNQTIDGPSLTPNYAGVLSAATSVTISSTTHGFATRDLVTECWDTSVSPNERVEGYVATVSPTTYQVVFTFPAAFTGRCIINGASSGGAGGGGGGATLPIDLTADVSGVLPVANGGTGTSSPGLVAGSNVTITGTWPNQTIASSGGGGGSGASTDHTYVVLAATSTLTNERAIAAGQGITITDGGAGNSLTIAADTAALYPMIRTSFSYDFPSITNNTCVLSSTQTFSGATTGSTGVVAVATSFPQGVNLQLAKVPASDQVAIEACNHSGTGYDPTSLTYTVTLFTQW